MKKALNNFLLLFPLFFSSTILGQAFKTGDLFLAQGSGIIQWRDSAGTLIKNINTGDGGANGNQTFDHNLISL